MGRPHCNHGTIKSKEKQSIEALVFVKSRGADREPTMCWFAPCVLRKRDAVMSKVAARIRLKCMHVNGAHNNI